MKGLIGMLALALIGLAPETATAQFELVNPFWEKSTPRRAAPAPLWSNITCRDS